MTLYYTVLCTMVASTRFVCVLLSRCYYNFLTTDVLTTDVRTKVLADLLILKLVVLLLLLRLLHTVLYAQDL
jgi:hypothetical protein